VNEVEAIEHVGAGGLVAFPTETTWGLGADASSPASLARLHAWKGRDRDKPVSLLVTGLGDLEALGAEPNPAARRLAERFWPGPLTLVVRVQRPLAVGLVGPSGGVGLRCSPHPVASALARLASERGLGPLTATSLNHSGEAECRTRPEAAARVAGAFPLLDGPDAGGGLPSSVVDVTDPVPVVLREGAVSRQSIARALEDIAA